VVEHISVIETSFDHLAVVTKKFKKRMDGQVNYFDVDIVSEYLLFDAGLEQFPGNTEIAYFSRIGKLFKDIRVASSVQQSFS
jgi:hypothetical protein